VIGMNQGDNDVGQINRQGRLFVINKRLLATVYRIVYDGRANSHLQQRSKLRRQRESFSWAGDDLRTSFTSLILDGVDYSGGGGDGDSDGGGDDDGGGGGRRNCRNHAS